MLYLYSYLPVEDNNFFLKYLPFKFLFLNTAVHYSHLHLIVSEPGSSVGIATDYGLDGPGSNPGGDEIFRVSRPALAPTRPPVKWVPSLSRR